jgi:hypothetical protein
MPGFWHGLSDSDIADLLSYVREGKCCFESEEPPSNPLYKAEQIKWFVPSGLKGGVHGLVRTASGETLEGIRVQLVAPNGVRETVQSDAKGNYEFPSMQAGTYTLRIATPAPYKAYRLDAVRVEGTAKLVDIVLEKVPEEGGAGALPGALPNDLRGDQDGCPPAQRHFAEVTNDVFLTGPGSSTPTLDCHHSVK